MGKASLRVCPGVVAPYLFDVRVPRQFIRLPLGLTEHDGFPVAPTVNLDHARQYRRALGPVAGDGEMLQRDQDTQGEGKGRGKQGKGSEKQN